MCRFYKFYASLNFLLCGMLQKYWEKKLYTYKLRIWNVIYIYEMSYFYMWVGMWENYVEEDIRKYTSQDSENV